MKYTNGSFALWTRQFLSAISRKDNACEFFDRPVAALTRQEFCLGEYKKEKGGE